jgi:hypothetical protein
MEWSVQDLGALGELVGSLAVSTAIENEPLNREQLAFTDWFFEANFVYYENNHFQHKLGLVDLEHWQATQNSIKRVLTMATAREYWTNNSHTYRDSFRIRVDEILKSMNL